MPWQKYYLGGTQKIRQVLDLLEGAWAHLQKGQRRFTGRKISTTLRLPEVPLWYLVF